MSICKDCVFCGEIAERKQEVCGLYEEPVEAVKACVAAHISGRCERKMTRTDVRGMVRELEMLQRQRDSQKELLEVVQRVITAALREDKDDAQKV